MLLANTLARTALIPTPDNPFEHPDATMHRQKSPKQTTPREKQSPLRLPTTYANHMDDKEIFAAWGSYVGQWISRDKSGEEIISIVLIPRLPRPGKDKSHGTLAGFIPKGEFEGALFFQGLSDKGRRNITGHLYTADRNLTRLEARLLLHHRQKPGTRGGKKRLILQIKRKRKRKEYLLEWVRGVHDTALSKICIIGHRGLGFSGLDNTPKGLRYAWYFGASGIEFDVMVPYRYSYMTNGEPSRIPMTNRLMVYHPPVFNQTFDVDLIPEVFSPAKNVFKELKNYWVPFVYVDPKLKWLSTDNVRQTLGKISRLASTALNRNSSLNVTIAAPIDRAARFLSRREGFQSSPDLEKAQLSWTLEWTEVDKAKHILARAKKSPSTLSFNLTQIDGSLKWSLVEWLFRDVSTQDEKDISRRSQILIFWTANDDDHFRGSLCAATDPKRMGRPGEPGEIGIMTDYPHRLAYWLATSSSRGFRPPRQAKRVRS